MLGKIKFIILFKLVAISSLAQLKNTSVGVNLYELVSPGVVFNKGYLDNKVTATLGGNFIKIDFPQYVHSDIGLPDTLVSNGDFSLGRVYLSVDYKLYKSIGIVGGLQYNIFQSDVYMSLTKPYQYDFEFGGQEFVQPIPESAIGTLQIKTFSNVFAGFLGISFGNKIPENKISFSAEIGAMYQGELNTWVEDRVIEANLPHETVYLIVRDEPDFDKTITDYKAYLTKYEFFPYLSFSVNYKIR